MKYKWFFNWLLIKYISWLKICKNKQSEYNYYKPQALILKNIRDDWSYPNY